MTRKMKKMMPWVITAVIAAVVIVSYVLYQNQPGQYDKLAQCVSDSGAKFYGAFWCPHCQDQKKIFGRSAQLLPYIECSTPDGQNTTVTCTKDGVSQFPTWSFADGERQVGTMTLEELAAKTNCSIN